MRDGRLTSFEERYAEGDNTVIMPELTLRLLTSEARSAVRAADAGGTDVIPISLPDMAVESAPKGKYSGNHHGD
jgi:hypothetical protein